MRFSLLYLFCLLSTKIISQNASFTGTVIFQIREDTFPAREVTYYFGNDFIKKVDTSDTHISRAGFSEFIWDIKGKKEYILNHQTQTVYFKDILYETDKALFKIDRHQMGNVLNYQVFSAFRSDSSILNIGDKRDTMFSRTRLYVSEAFTTKPVKDIMFEHLNLSSGFVPLQIESEGKLSSLSGGYRTVVRAISISRGPIPESTFGIPKNYTIKPFNEYEIKVQILKAAERKINFLERVKKIMNENGMLE